MLESQSLLSRIIIANHGGIFSDYTDFQRLGPRLPASRPPESAERQLDLLLPLGAECQPSTTSRNSCHQRPAPRPSSQPSCLIPFLCLTSLSHILRRLERVREETEAKRGGCITGLNVTEYVSGGLTQSPRTLPVSSVTPGCVPGHTHGPTFDTHHPLPHSLPHPPSLEVS